MKKEVKKPTLAVVVPCFDEEKVLGETHRVLSAKLKEMELEKKISLRSFLIFVDDGSSDGTWKMIEKFAKGGKIIGVKLAKNAGHQNALLAGLEAASEKADAIVSIDADLQDDVNVIPLMIDEYSAGAEIVYGVREKRSEDRWFKKTSAKMFYRLMTKLGVDMVSDSADFRLMSKRAIDELLKYEETNLFLRGIVPRLGFKAATVKYERKVRTAGESKYTLDKMMNFASDGVTSFSTKPIRAVLALGAAISVTGLLALGVMLIIRLVSGGISGNGFIFAAVWAVGGLQLLAIGIIGEYVGKINFETKKRPRYVIEKVIQKRERKTSRK